MIQYNKIVTRRTVYNKLSYKDTEYSIVILTLLKATNRLKLTRFILSNQTVVACVQASVKARHPPYRAHGNFKALLY